MRSSPEREQQQTKDKLIFFDTTLRDGEQSPGVTLTVEEKIDIAKHLSRLGVDVCEAGFPVASEGDFNAVQRIAREVGPLMTGRDAIGKPMTICGLARATENDIRRAFAAVQPAPSHRIHIFLATSDIHLEHKLRITREECIKRASEAVRLASSLCSDVEFSPEDAGRSDREYLCEVLAAVIEAGATTLNIPDTVGYNTPDEYGNMIKYLVENTVGSEKVIWSTHCHNDLGLATANTLSGITNGARQVEVTMNGIGERAGNTALEEVIMAIHTHPDSFPVYHTICTEKISRVSTLVSNLSGMVVQPNKAIVGSNAFLHESGIHQDSVLKNKQTYEIIRPETVGIFTDNLILGNHFPRAAFRSRLQALGYGDMTEGEFQRAFERFKALVDVKKRITEHDIVALLSDQVFFSEGFDTFSLLELQVVGGLKTVATATVRLEDHRYPNESPDRQIMDAAIGRAGPINAVFCAITRLTQLPIRLRSFEVRSVDEGMEALAQVVVHISKDTDASDGSSDSTAMVMAEDSDPISATDKERIHQGVGTDNDVLTASAKAFVNAINRMIRNQEAGSENAVLSENEGGVKRTGAVGDMVVKKARLERKVSV